MEWQVSSARSSMARAVPQNPRQGSLFSSVILHPLSFLNGLNGDPRSEVPEVGIEFECPGCDLAETFAATQADSQGNQVMLPAEFKSAFGQAPVNFAHVKRPIGFTQDDRRSLWDAEIVEANIARFLRLPDFCNLGIDLRCLHIGWIVKPMT